MHKCKQCGQIEPFVKFKTTYQRKTPYKWKVCNKCINFKNNPPKWRRRELFREKIKQYWENEYDTGTETRN